MSQRTVKSPPTDARGILRNLGPGLILAGGIVGSGELIATTRTGAEAGFALLWLIILGCILKVFTQVEIARHCITHSETTVTALTRIPGVGPFIGWFWLITFLFGLGQLGGIVGGVGQALKLAWPLHPDLEIGFYVFGADKTWAVILTIVAIFPLRFGGFSLIETVCTLLVCTFTFITVGNVIMLQIHDTWALGAEDLRDGFGLSLIFDDDFKLPPLGTALATFGIIGVGGSEVVAYPYWCLEKGYGAWTGPREQTETWAERARGWLRVLQWDAWGSMVIYTISTVAFYILGAAVLHREGILPERSEMISQLSEMYLPAFGPTAMYFFLIGAFAVLFSTFFVSNATKARLMTDALFVFRFRHDDTDENRLFWKNFFSVAFPLTCLAIYLIYPRPVILVLLSGLMQALLIPMLALAALYFRYARSDKRLRSGWAWDVALWCSFAAFVVVGIVALMDKWQAVAEIISNRF